MMTKVKQTVRALGGKGGVTVSFGDVTTTETHTHIKTRTSSRRIVKGSGNTKGDTRWGDRK
jgi:hypothetical protein